MHYRMATEDAWATWLSRSLRRWQGGQANRLQMYEADFADTGPYDFIESAGLLSCWICGGRIDEYKGLTGIFQVHQPN